jgi:hypothetical protein
MITLETILENTWAIVKNLIIYACVILTIGKVSAMVLDLSPALCVGSIFFFSFVVGIGTIYTPLFTNYKEYVAETNKIIKNLRTESQNLKAERNDMLADIEAYEKLVSTLQAELEKEKQYASRIETEVSTEQAAYKLEIAKLEQKLHEANQHLSIVGAENKDRKLSLDKLKGMEEFLFLKELGLQPDQVVNGLAKVIAGMQNNKTPEQKGRIQAIVSRVLKGNTININPVESE